MSTHVVECIKLGKIEKHPNADMLGVTTIYDGYECIVRLSDFNEGDLAIYIEPDMVCPNREEFAFLGDKLRIKSRRYRKLWSQGLLIKAPEGAKVGDDFFESWGFSRYEPFESPSFSGLNETPHPTLACAVKYDLENFRKYGNSFIDGEEVIVTEKIHGTNARYAYRDGTMWCGSRTGWKKKDDSCVWWNTLTYCPWIEEWCKANEDKVIYGEVFGQVQKGFDYGVPKGTTKFLAFDILVKGNWLDPKDFLEVDGIERVPLLYRGSFDRTKLIEMSHQDSTLSKHMSEGIVIKPLVYRYDRRAGRLALKLVSDRYLEK